jgi:hypothetical protein
MKKIGLISFLFLVVVLFLYGESRKFFYLEDGRCITVWKTYNNICYVLPGKYYGLIKPSVHNYIKTNNINNLDIIWTKNNDSLIVNFENNDASIFNSGKGVKIVNYTLNQKYNDSAFTYVDRGYRRYRNQVDYMSIFLKDNYAIDKNGKKL